MIIDPSTDFIRLKLFQRQHRSVYSFSAYPHYDLLNVHSRQLSNFGSLNEYEL